MFCLCSGVHGAMYGSQGAVGRRRQSDVLSDALATALPLARVSKAASGCSEYSFSMGCAHFLSMCDVPYSLLYTVIEAATFTIPES